MSFGSFVVVFTASTQIRSILQLIVLAVLSAIIAHKVFFLAHDCVHRSLLKSIPMNRYVGGLASGLLFQPFHRFESVHLAHHRHLWEANDPGARDYQKSFKSRKDLVWFYIQPLLGMNFIELFSKATYVQRLQLRMTTVRRMHVGSFLQVGAIQASLLATSLALSPMGIFHYLLIGVYPPIFGFSFLSRIRMHLEHGRLHARLDDPHGVVVTRNIQATAIERCFLTGSNFELHKEHHETPRLPSSLLKSKYELRTKTPVDSVELIDGSSYKDVFFAHWKQLRVADKKTA